ncbi:MAG: MXAN_6577-like cysteine-rich protein [Polyangiales bacterium]
MEDVVTPMEDVVTPMEDVVTPPKDVPPTCQSGEILCGGGCVDPQTSNTHCGACDRACGGAETCRAGVCTPTVTCMSGETSCGGGCVNTMTDVSHCGGCVNVCGAGQVCNSGTCADPRMCRAGQTDCTPTAPKPTCVDTQTSTANCGACGTACAAGDTCGMGVCQPPACPSGQTRCTTMGVSTCVDATVDHSNCGACGTVCGVGEACMGGMCRSTCVAPRLTCMVNGMPTCLDVQTDNANCGACGTTCANGQTCQAGRCACPTGRTACGGACVDTRTDEANCGMCGTRCPSAQTCTAGVCACPRGQTLCGSACVNTSTDIANCGRCGTRCTAPATCSAGVCNSLCGAGTTSCGGRCVALTTFQTDNANCGSCGNACGTGTRCTAGVCRPTNDNRTSAIVITPNTAREVTVTGNTTNATNDGPTVPCGCTSGGNVWYRFTTPAAGLVYLDTAGSAYDTSLYLTNSSGTALPGQAGTGFASAGLCNDDAGCGTGGGFTSGLQSRTAGVLAAGTYYVAVGGCGAGAFTLRLQYVRSDIGRSFTNARLSGTGNTGTVTLPTGASAAAGTCGGSSSTENVSWFLTCGATGQTQLFSTCRSDPGAFFIRRLTSSSTANFDPVMYVRSAQTGAQVGCNDDGSGAGVDCRGVIPIIAGANIGALDTLQRGSRLSGLATPRGVGLVFSDGLVQSAGMRYNMRFQIP